MFYFVVLEGVIGNNSSYLLTFLLPFRLMMLRVCQSDEHGTEHGEHVGLDERYQ